MKQQWYSYKLLSAGEPQYTVVSEKLLIQEKLLSALMDQVARANRADQTVVGRCEMVRRVRATAVHLGWTRQRKL